MSNFFEGARDFTISGGNFGPNYTRHSGPVYHTNDYSQHTTTYGGYVNYGQHADRGGTFNNYSPQTMNPSASAPTIPEFRAPPRPNSRPAPSHQYRQSHSQAPPNRSRRDGNFPNEHYDDDSSGEDDEPRLPPRPSQRPRTAPPRPNQGNRPGNREDSVDKELKTLSPEMQRYIQNLMKKRNAVPMPSPDDLQDRMESMRLDDTEPSEPPAGRSGPRVRTPKLPRRDVNPVPQSSDGDSDSEENSVPLRGGTTIINTNSHNVNSSTVVDSHNDNSTRTQISKAR